MMLERAAKERARDRARDRQRDRERRAQQMLRRVVGASPDVIYVYHVPWRRIAFLGQRVREVLGFAAARSHRLKLSEFERLVHPADLAGFRRHLAAVEHAGEGEILCEELRIKGSDGRYRWLRTRDSVLARDAQGAVTRVVGVVTNIDQAKRASAIPAAIAANAESVGRLGDILATIDDCYIALDCDYRIVDINLRAERWLGLRREEIIGQCYLELIAPTGEHAEALRGAVELRVPGSLEIASERRPGAWLELHIHPSRDGASVLFRDITGRKHAEREVERSRQLLQSSLDALSVQIAILDAAGTIVAVNKAWQGGSGQHALSGARVGDNVLALWGAMWRCEEAESLRRGLASVLSGERCTARFAYSTQMDDQRRWFQISLERFEWDGEARLIVANEDLTDVNQAKQALSELSGRVTSLREEERQRIAQELHDSTAQHLVAATLNLMTLKAKSVAYPGVHKLLENVESSLEEATRELRVFTYLLHPLALENDGLERTLRTYLEGFGRRTRLKVHLAVSGNVDELPFELQCSILRIIQEALANVHRHACASQVSIDLRMTPSALNLVVTDDGRGMLGPAGQAEARAAQAGVGIPGMRARVRDFGGRLDIHSGPRGTTLSAAIPLGLAGSRWHRPHERALAMPVMLESNST